MKSKSIQSRILWSLKSMCVGISLALIGCQNTDYLYIQPQVTDPTVTVDHKIKELLGASMVDILWVIDNSGSMGDYQDAVIYNTELFMNAFTKQANMRWKMGLISTDLGDEPYVGFQSYDVLDQTTSDPVEKFKDAVGKLGTYGSAEEQTYDPVKTALNNYSSFLRPGAVLALIVVTDAKEQSRYTTSAQFLDYLVKKKGNIKDVVSYGVFAPRDFGCKSADDEWTYAGSKYEEMIVGTAGKAYRLCDPNFGSNLASIGQEISKLVTFPKIVLGERPVPESIRVLSHGIEVPGGPEYQGGHWEYDYERNAIIFHDLDFAHGDDEQVTVKYTPAKI